ncbi:hypothetical protein UA08_09382 [Talaromyces atroroseus]|uniref:Transcription factor domain-containing protein n=1 Tax=Talaromyces atroroseus TaxID=1441469 RepID=A0A1Q5Q6H7_TALAT|nr:hypothetical protein UA08_09382 [Talaromyces atroroseus]OKL55373.1 hypothetical protein UA08_09382 [Talaromyces atroroseus]
MARMQVTLDVFQNAHRTMVLDNETPWSHPLLYRNFMPRSMQADLLASEQPTSAIECLARLQALIIYQTIRLFDDDTSARLAAAMTMPALRSSLTYFLQNVYVDDTLAFGNPPISSLLEEPSSSSAADHGLSRDFWQTWIFEESARRTIFLAYLLIRIWEVMYIFSNNNDKAEQEKKQQMRKNHKCDGRLGSSHCWYLSSHLWQARTRYEFALAYAEKNRFLIRDLDFTEFLAFGYPDDVDMFGKMVLSASMGIEAFQNWCSARGGM